MDGVKSITRRTMTFVVFGLFFMPQAEAANAVTRMVTRMLEGFIDPQMFQIFGLIAVVIGLVLWLFRFTGPWPAVSAIFVGALLYSVQWWVPEFMLVR
jgi:uncharacterized membrane protein